MTKRTTTKTNTKKKTTKKHGGDRDFLRAHCERLIGLPFMGYFYCVGRTLSIWLKDLEIVNLKTSSIYKSWNGQVTRNQSKSKCWSSVGRPQFTWRPQSFCYSLDRNKKIHVLLLNSIAKPSCIWFSFLKPDLQMWAVNAFLFGDWAKGI